MSNDDPYHEDEPDRGNTEAQGEAEDKAAPKPKKRVRVRGSKAKKAASDGATAQPDTASPPPPDTASPPPPDTGAAPEKNKNKKTPIRVKRTKPDPDTAKPEPIGGNAKAALKGYVQRLNNLMDEHDALKDDIGVVLAEAKATGFNTPALRAAMKLIRMSDDQIIAAQDKADEAQHIRELVG